MKRFPSLNGKSLRRSLQHLLVGAVTWALLSLAPNLYAQRAYGATNAHPGPAWFVDVAAQAGLRVRNVNGSETNKQYIVESTGSGVAVLDYDDDGWPDIFLVNGSTLPGVAGKEKPTSHLFHNNHDGTFTDVTKGSGLEETCWGQGAFVRDYDNDGLPDLFVTAYGRNRLFHNEGKGRFKEVAESAGVAGQGRSGGRGVRLWTMTAMESWILRWRTMCILT